MPLRRNGFGHGPATALGKLSLLLRSHPFSNSASFVISRTSEPIFIISRTRWQDGRSITARFSGEPGASGTPPHPRSHDRGGIWDDCIPGRQSRTLDHTASTQVRDEARGRPDRPRSLGGDLSHLRRRESPSDDPGPVLHAGRRASGAGSWSSRRRGTWQTTRTPPPRELDDWKTSGAELGTGAPHQVADGQRPLLRRAP